MLPFSEERGLRLGRELTDPGPEFCGAPDRHEDGLSLAVEDIDRSPSALVWGLRVFVRVRFPTTEPNEFDQVAFRKTLDRTLECSGSDAPALP